MRWIRLWTEETLTGTTFSELNAAQRGIWFSLLILAGRPPREGIVEARKGVGYAPEHLALELQVDKDVLMDAIKRLIEVKKVSTIPSKSTRFPLEIRLKIAKWKQYQTEYAKYRKGKKDKRLGVGYTSNETIGYISTTDSDVDVDIDTDLDVDEEEASLSDFARLLVNRWNTEVAAKHKRVAPVEIRKRYPPLGATRMKHIKARYEDEHFRENVDRMFQVIELSEGAWSGAFTYPDSNKPWIINFDFLIKNDSNYLKVLEGKYVDRKDRGKYDRLWDGDSVSQG